MKCYLDSNIVIYVVENPLRWGALAVARIAALATGGCSFVVSDLSRMEVRVGPLRAGDTATLSEYDAFFARPDVETVALTRAAFDRAATIRARYGFRPLDSVHLAAAAEAACELFLTHDAGLGRFADLPVELLT